MFYSTMVGDVNRISKEVFYMHEMHEVVYLSIYKICSPQHRQEVVHLSILND